MITHLFHAILTFFCFFYQKKTKKLFFFTFFLTFFCFVFLANADVLKAMVADNSLYDPERWVLLPPVFQLFARAGFPTLALLTFGPDNHLLWETVLCLGECLTTFLASAHWMPVSLSPQNVSAIVNVPCGAESPLVPNCSVREWWREEVTACVWGPGSSLTSATYWASLLGEVNWPLWIQVSSPMRCR